MRQIPKPQEIYRHFKGNIYQIITLAEHSETGEPLVIYQALYGTYQVYARPLDSFQEPVDKVKYPYADQAYRFELIRPEEEKDDRMKTEAGTETGAETGAETGIDPMVWNFLDAGSHEERLNILAALHHRITDEMITTMAIACDIEVPEGSLEERYSQLKNCLQMLDRFEIRR